jgi:hypothetical protein
MRVREQMLTEHPRPSSETVRVVPSGMVSLAAKPDWLAPCSETIVDKEAVARIATTNHAVRSASFIIVSFLI